MFLDIARDNLNYNGEIRIFVTELIYGLYEWLNDVLTHGGYDTNIHRITLSQDDPNYPYFTYRYTKPNKQTLSKKEEEIPGLRNALNNINIFTMEFMTRLQSWSRETDYGRAPLAINHNDPGITKPSVHGEFDAYMEKFLAMLPDFTIRDICSMPTVGHPYDRYEAYKRVYANLNESGQLTSVVGHYYKEVMPAGTTLNLTNRAVVTAKIHVASPTGLLMNFLGSEPGGLGKLDQLASTSLLPNLTRTGVKMKLTTRYYSSGSGIFDNDAPTTMDGRYYCTMVIGTPGAFSIGEVLPILPNQTSSNLKLRIFGRNMDDQSPIYKDQYSDYGFSEEILLLENSYLNSYSFHLVTLNKKYLLNGSNREEFSGESTTPLVTNIHSVISLKDNQKANIQKIVNNTKGKGVSECGGVATIYLLFHAYEPVPSNHTYFYHHYRYQNSRSSDLMDILF